MGKVYIPVASIKIEPDFYANHRWMSSISTACHFSLTCRMQEWYQKRFQKNKKG